MSEHASQMDPDRQDAPRPSLEAGVVVSERYELVRLLGRGAAGVVWLATHQLLTTEVAVKFLDAASAEVDDPAFLVERFRFEAQVSARLAKRTDRIVAVHDGGMFRGRPFIVMDLIDGASVERLVDHGSLSVLEIVTMAKQVAEALDACHAESIAHRDVKPANILALDTPAGREFKLADFGVAKLFGVAPKGVLAPRATAEQSLVGSPAYMSPETISGDRTTSGAADIWALAVTLYEALTRTLPFEGDGGWPSIAVAIVSRRYTPASSLLGVEAAPLDLFFERAFAHAPQDRFASASDLAHAFEAAVEPLRSLPRSLDAPSAPRLHPTHDGVTPTTGERPAPPRRRSLAGPIAIVAAVVVLGAGLAVVLRGPPATSWTGTSAVALAPGPSGHAQVPETRPVASIDATATGSALTLSTPTGQVGPSAPLRRASPSASQVASAATSPPPAVVAPTVAAPPRTSRPIDPSEIQ